MDPVARLKASIDQVRPVVAATDESLYGKPTPCTDWTVRELVNHLVGALTMFRDVGEKGGADLALFGGDLVGDDLLAAYDARAGEALAVWAQPGKADGVASMPWGDMPAGIALQMLADDVLVHGWDLAKATGQSVEWDQALAGETLEFAQGFFTSEIRGGEFAAPVEGWDDADAMTRLVTFLGRTP